MQVLLPHLQREEEDHAVGVAGALEALVGRRQVLQRDGRVLAWVRVRFGVRARVRVGVRFRVRVSSQGEG
eukprot:scaffold114470_cov39-Phaeocystis_antarctica.AAC.1